MYKIIFVKIFIFCCFNINFLQAFNVKNEKVIMCGVGKNIAQYLPNMIQKIEALGNCFKDYSVVIYENNSRDQTVHLLNKWASVNSKITVISETLNSEQLYKRTIAHAKRDSAPCRMELIAYARNEVLKKAMSEQFNGYNFVIMTDLDFSRGWDIRGVLSSFDSPIAWDCIAANSIDGSGNYYDRYAYRDDQFPLGPELIGEDFWQGLGKFPVRIPTGSEFIKVYSAFGGIAIYRKEALKDCQYSGYVTADLEKLMFDVINKMPKWHLQYQHYRKLLLGIDDSPLPVRFQANSGYDSPVVCEHSTLHASMSINGYRRIYVNPAMVCYY